MVDSEAHRQPFSILVVDDEPDTLASLHQLLTGELENVEVHTVSTGPEALGLLKTHHVDLLIVDYRIAKMDGLEVLNRAREVAPEADRVLVTAYAEVNVAIRAINESEVRRFFTKPIQPRELLDAVRHLRTERARRRSQSQAFARGLDAQRRGGHRRKNRN